MSGCDPHHTASEFANAAGSHTDAPSASDWEKVKDVIHRLYIDDQCRLKDVQDQLERDYGFKAR